MFWSRNKSVSSLSFDKTTEPPPPPQQDKSDLVRIKSGVYLHHKDESGCINIANHLYLDTGPVSRFRDRYVLVKQPSFVATY